MKLHIHHTHEHELGPLSVALLKELMATLEQALQDITAAVSAAADELTTLLTELKAAVAANDPTRIQAAADAIEVQVASLNAATGTAKAGDPTQPPAAPVTQAPPA